MVALTSHSISGGELVRPTNQIRHGLIEQHLTPVVRHDQPLLNNSGVCETSSDRPMNIEVNRSWIEHMTPSKVLKWLLCKSEVRCLIASLLVLVGVVFMPLAQHV